MAMHKAIMQRQRSGERGREWRTEYGTKGQPFCKAVDPSCRNHGSCKWCERNRTARNVSAQKIAKAEIRAAIMPILLNEYDSDVLIGKKDSREANQ